MAQIANFFNNDFLGVAGVFIMALVLAAAVFFILAFAARYHREFAKGTEKVLSAMRDHPEDAGILDVIIARFPGEVPTMWKRYRIGGASDVGTYIDRRTCVDIPLNGRMLRVIAMGLLSILIAALALVFGAAVNNNSYTLEGIWPALAVFLCGVILMFALNFILNFRYKKVLRSYYTLTDVLALNLPRRRTLFLTAAANASDTMPRTGPAPAQYKPGAAPQGAPASGPAKGGKAKPASAPEPIVLRRGDGAEPEITISPVGTKREAPKADALADGKAAAAEGSQAPAPGADPAKEDIVEKIDRITKENASKQTMIEVAKLLNAERRKPENQEPMQQKRLNDALSKLLKAMAAAPSAPKR